MKKYPQIESLVPEKEHFDESAINEGVYLTVGHIDNIEQTLANATTATEAIQESLDAEVEKTTELTATINSLNQAATATTQAIAAKDAAIIVLEAKVAELGGKSSGKGTALTIKEDEQENSSKQPSYLDDNNPINSWIDTKVKKK